MQENITIYSMKINKKPKKGHQFETVPISSTFVAKLK